MLVKAEVRGGRPLGRPRPSRAAGAVEGARGSSRRPPAPAGTLRVKSWESQDQGMDPQKDQMGKQSERRAHRRRPHRRQRAEPGGRRAPQLQGAPQTLLRPHQATGLGSGVWGAWGQVEGDLP